MTTIRVLILSFVYNSWGFLPTILNHIRWHTFSSLLIWRRLKLIPLGSPGHDFTLIPLLSVGTRTQHCLTPALVISLLAASSTVPRCSFMLCHICGLERLKRFSKLSTHPGEPFFLWVVYLCLKEKSLWASIYSPEQHANLSCHKQKQDKKTLVTISIRASVYTDGGRSLCRCLDIPSSFLCSSPSPPCLCLSLMWAVHHVPCLQIGHTCNYDSHAVSLYFLFMLMTGPVMSRWPIKPQSTRAIYFYRLLIIVSISVEFLDSIWISIYFLPEVSSLCLLQSRFYF